MSIAASGMFIGPPFRCVTGLCVSRSYNDDDKKVGVYLVVEGDNAGDLIGRFYVASCQRETPDRPSRGIFIVHPLSSWTCGVIDFSSNLIKAPPSSWVLCPRSVPLPPLPLPTVGSYLRMWGSTGKGETSGARSSSSAKSWSWRVKKRSRSGFGHCFRVLTCMEMTGRLTTEYYYLGRV